MTGVAFRSSIPAIPVPIAVSVWSGSAAAVGLALVLLGADREARAEVPPETAVVAPTLATGRVLGGQSAAGQVTVSRGHVRASLPFRSESSLYGWGTVRFDSEPVEDEVTVRTIIDAPTEHRRWSARCDVVLRVDGHEVRTSATPAGTRMKTGAFYDALQLELGIDTVRRITQAAHVTGEVCGDPLEVSEAQRETLRGFVESFDELALPVAPSRETPPELAPLDPDEPVEDPDSYLEPA